MVVLNSFRSIILLAVLCLSAFLPGRAVADEVRVGIGFAIPPYVIKSENSGVEVDVIRQAFKAVGHDAVFVYLPNLRLPLAFAHGSVDCIAVNSAFDLAGETGREVHSSKTTVVFQNYAVTLGERRVGGIGDLAGMRVLGFNNACKYLGPEFAAMALANPGYSELADQSLQVRMLYSGRVDAIITDKRIFQWWRKKVASDAVADVLKLDRAVVFNPIFPAAPRHVAFADPRLRGEFDEGLALIVKNGEYEKILSRYVDADAIE